MMDKFHKLIKGNVLALDWGGSRREAVKSVSLINHHIDFFVFRDLFRTSRTLFGRAEQGAHKAPSIGGVK
ncbi:MAG: hypothetical protein HQM00_11655 [Magnetococcales bacterium]|nr:hypothetical protein [Magnetococcales bacterium]